MAEFVQTLDFKRPDSWSGGGKIRMCRTQPWIAHLNNASALSDARLHEKERKQGELGGARSIKPPEGSRSPLRRNVDLRKAGAGSGMRRSTQGF
jgi:hypothetical protein